MQVNLEVGLQSVSSEHVALASRSSRTYHGGGFPLMFRNGMIMLQWGGRKHSKDTIRGWQLQQLQQDKDLEIIIEEQGRSGKHESASLDVHCAYYRIHPQPEVTHSGWGGRDPRVLRSSQRV